MSEEQIDIPAIRAACGLTQQGLADMAGVNLSTVWRWENGNPPRGAAKVLLLRLRDDAPKQEKAG